jgi:hypothetical protein
MNMHMRTGILVAVVAAVLAPRPAPAADTELATAKSSTLTQANWSYRIYRLGDPQPCKVLQQPNCTQTRVDIVNASDAELACAGQVYFLLGENRTGYIENFGSLVAPRGRETAFEFENDDPIDPARSFVVCNTTAERDEADTGETSFAKRPPSACRFKLLSTPQLDDFYATPARLADQQGLVRIRVVFTAKKGSPVPLGVVQSSGFFRIDRGALLLASRMSFETNCPGTFTELPVRFQLAN